MGTLTVRQLVEMLEDELLDKPVTVGCCVGHSTLHPVTGIYAGTQSITVEADETEDFMGPDDDGTQA